MPFRRAVAVGCFVPLPVCFGKLALLFAYELILYTLLSSSSMHSMEVVCIICILRRSYLVVCILESTILLLARVEYVAYDARSTVECYELVEVCIL